MSVGDREFIDQPIYRNLREYPYAYRFDNVEVGRLVTDGRLDVRLVPRAGFEKPRIKAIRVSHRPDR